jgi:hypothetical protein
MYFLNFNPEIIIKLEVVNISLLKCHEEVIFERKAALVVYLNSLFPDLIVPSLIVCHKTHTIIDGHHRFHALKEMGFKNVPVTFINYQSDSIMPYFDNRISKSEILDASKNKQFLSPKSSKHIIFDTNINKWVPIHLISSLYSYYK